ncbi:MAG: LutB/LldF family L-lactate oxidation iron-sulfur protein [Nitriliruptorales bacterium]|nr:LutB/LldF family L-lactate oxidation iron-sulfur protein [Nitriliruptorales bacterium]
MSHELLAGTTLRQRATHALADEQLRRTLRTTTAYRDGLRRQAEAGLTNHPELRAAARRVRSQNLAKLPELLDQVATRWEDNGGTVFFAQDAREANAYIVDVALEHDVTSAVKSKSMLTEELRLNDALVAAGIEVTETDLGEWIVQLAEQPPSHILTPAVHLTRSDIRELFEPVAGRDLSDVPEELTAFAREELRRRFLAADLGITGCNFAVAQTGTVTLVMNEGNGRMVTTLPPLHIAVIGMERVVETWGELDLMLHLLPRAATGQDVTVYVNHLSGPRRAGELDGPKESHLVIVDNGRSGMLGSEFQEMLHCIRCGACLNTCPVYRQIGGHAYGWTYSGPMGAVLAPLLHELPEAKELPQASSLCGACHDACPVGIPLQDLLLGLRRHETQSAASSAEDAAWRAWAAAWSRPATYRATTAAAARLGRFVPPGLLPDAWTDSRAAPRPDPGGGFRARFRRGED